MEVNNMAIFTTAVLAFLAGTITGIVGMFCADTKYIKTIQKSQNNILKIMASTYRERERRLKRELGKYRIQGTEAKK